jgi:arabinofuranan 3-O-arabinosyltransferase
MLNAYRLTTTFDSLPVMAMIAASVLAGLVIRAAGESRPRPLVFAFASLLCAFVFLNPPHLAIVVAWVAASALLAVAVHGRRASGRLLRFLGVGVPLAILFNLWWIVPAALAITNPTFDARFAAAGVSDWAWTHVRGDVGNVVALTSSWAWGRPEYFPFSVRLGTFPFTVLQFVPAASALLGVAVARGRYRVVAAALFAIGAVAIWVMKGLHEPFGETNMWLYDHIPGFWLLREPTKLALVLVLVYALLAAIAVEHIERRSRSLGRTVAAVIVVAAAVYAYPFFTGAVVPTHRPLLPSAQVRFPDEWHAAARFLDGDASAGKVVVLPRLDYYQAPTTWGYYGSTFVHQLFTRPVIDAPLPGGYYRDPVVPDLITQLERRILTGKGEVATILRALGARYVLLRRDLATDFPQRSFTAPRLLAQAARQRHELRLIPSFGVADLYEARDLRAPEVYAAVPLIQPPGVSASSVHADVDIGEDAVTAAPSGQRLLAGIRTGRVQEVPAGSPLATELARIGADQPPHRAARSAATASRHSFRLVVGSQSFVAEGRLRRVAETLASPVATPLRRTLPEPRAVPLTPKLARSVGDCYKYDERSLRRVGITARVITTSSRRTLRLTANDHSACVAIWLPGTRAPAGLQIGLSYRTVRGQPARLCIWQEGPDRCARSPALASEEGWRRLDAVVRVARRTRALGVFLYADGGAPGGTVTEYRDLSLARRVETTAVAVAPIVALPDVSYRRVSPSEFRVRVRGARGPFLLVGTETFAPGWRVEAPGRDTSAVRHLPVNGYANAWRIPWAGSYELTIDYAPERAASAARRLDLVVVPLGLLALLWRPTLRRRRRAIIGPRRP